MFDVFFSPAAQILLLTFYWVPFALGAYLVEHFDAEKARRSIERLVHPFRHIGHHRPTAATGAA